MSNPKRILLPPVPQSPDLPDVSVVPQPIARSPGADPSDANGEPSVGSRVVPFHPQAIPEPDFTFVHVADGHNAGNGPEGANAPMGLESALALIKYQREDIQQLQQKTKMLSYIVACLIIFLFVSAAGLVLGALWASRADQYATNSGVSSQVSDSIGKLQSQIPEPYQLTNGSIVTQFIADQAVTNSKLAINAVSTGQITAGSVTASKLDTNVQGLLNVVSTRRAVNPDDFSLEFNLGSGQLQVKDGGIAPSKLSPNIVSSSSGLSLSGADNSIQLNADPALLIIDGSNQLSIRSNSLASAQMQDGGIEFPKFSAAFQDNFRQVENLTNTVDARFREAVIAFGPVDQAVALGRPAPGQGVASSETVLQGQSANALSTLGSVESLGGSLVLRAGSGSSGHDVDGGSIRLQSPTGLPLLDVSASGALNTSLHTVALNADDSLALASMNTLLVSGASSVSIKAGSLAELAASNGSISLNAASRVDIMSGSAAISTTGKIGLTASSALSLSSSESLLVSAPLQIIDAAQQLKAGELAISSLVTINLDYSSVRSSFVRLTGSSGGVLNLTVSNCDDSRAGISITVQNRMRGANDQVFISQETCNGVYSTLFKPGQFVVLSCLGNYTATNTQSVHCLRPEFLSSAGGYSAVVGYGTIGAVSAPNPAFRCGSVSLNSVAGKLQLTLLSSISTGQMCVQFTNPAITNQHSGILISTVDAPGGLLLQRSVLNVGFVQLTLIYVGSTIFNAGEVAIVAFQLI
jgi:hypothetical protein